MAKAILIGTKDVLRRLRALELSQQRAHLIEAAKAGAVIAMESARRLAPVDTGALADGIRMRVDGRESDANEATVKVSYGKKQYYGIMQELGTKYHRAQSFLEPALENNRELIVRIMQNVIQRAIDRAVR